MRIRNLNKNLEILRAVSCSKTSMSSYDYNTSRIFHINYKLINFLHINIINKRSIEENVIKAVLQYKCKIKN